MNKIIVEIESTPKVTAEMVQILLEARFTLSDFAVKEVKLPDTVDGVVGKLVIGEVEG